MSKLNGYIGDIPYLRDFKPMLAPAWLDHAALVCGLAPPDRESGFHYCELGCGQGVTSAFLAATHPTGRFVAIDAMPMHIEHARKLAEAAQISNLALYAMDFATANDLGLGKFDYIVAHGVYSWIDPDSRRALLSFIDRHLKPGGLVYLSYNAMPGWATDLPFQHLLRALAGALPGDSAARVSQAVITLQSIAARGIRSLEASFILAEFENRPQDYTPAYLVHEFLHPGWQPLYVTEVRADAATIGLQPVGSATLAENCDELVLSRSARAALSAIRDENLRELVRDFFLDQRLRRDLFVRNGRRINPNERAVRLAAAHYGLARPIERRDRAKGPIVAALIEGCRALNEIAPITPEVVSRLIKLCAQGVVMPVEDDAVPVDRLNRVIAERLGGSEEILWLPLPRGTAVEIPRELFRRLHEGKEFGNFAPWLPFLVAHGILFPTCRKQPVGR